MIANLVPHSRTLTRIQTIPSNPHQDSHNKTPTTIQRKVTRI